MASFKAGAKTSARSSAAKRGWETRRRNAKARERLRLYNSFSEANKLNALKQFYKIEEIE